MLFVDAAHQRRGRGQHLIDEDEYGLFGRELDALADDIDELADSKIGGDKVFLLVNSGNVALFDLFTDDLVEEEQSV